jgi:hypothetical protein
MTHINDAVAYRPPGQLRGFETVQRSVESRAVKRRVICKSAAVKRRLYVCCSYSEAVIITMLKSVARITYHIMLPDSCLQSYNLSEFNTTKQGLTVTQRSLIY